MPYCGSIWLGNLVKPSGQELLVFGQPNLILSLSKWQVDKEILLLLCLIWSPNFRKIVKIEHLPLRAAILVSNVPRRQAPFCSGRNRAKTAKKWAKKCDARATMLFCLLNVLFFFLTFLLPSRPRILQSLLSRLYRVASQCDPAKLATLLAEPTFCFSCKRCTALCKEMYEMLARSPRVARVGGWPVYPRQRLSEVRIIAMIFENSANSLKWRFCGYCCCGFLSSLTESLTVSLYFLVDWKGSRRTYGRDVHIF